MLPSTVALNLGEPRLSAKIRRRMQAQTKTKENFERAKIEGTTRQCGGGKKTGKLVAILRRE